MPHKILIAPASGEKAVQHLKNTVEKLWTIEELRKIRPDLPDELVKKLKQQQFAIWGIMYGKRAEKTWNALEKGDIVLFYSKGKIIYWGFIIGKMHDEELAEKLWGRSNGRTWEYIFFIGNVKRVNIPFSEFVKRFLDYSERFIPVGHTLVKKEKIKAEFDNIIKFLKER